MIWRDFGSVCISQTDNFVFAVRERNVEVLGKVITLFELAGRKLDDVGYTDITVLDGECMCAAVEEAEQYLSAHGYV